MNINNISQVIIRDKEGKVINRVNVGYMAVSTMSDKTKILEIGESK